MLATTGTTPGTTAAPDVVKMLLRDFEEEWRRAQELLRQPGTDPIILAQTIGSAGESLVAAANEMAVRAHAAAKAARREAARG